MDLEEFYSGYIYVQLSLKFCESHINYDVEQAHDQLNKSHWLWIYVIASVFQFLWERWMVMHCAVRRRAAKKLTIAVKGMLFLPN